MSTHSMLPNVLRMERCPHCGIAKPLLRILWTHIPEGVSGLGPDNCAWATYECSACRHVVLAFRHVKLPPMAGTGAQDWYPSSAKLAEEIPERAREYLRQAQESLSQPAGSLMLCASAVDAMLKAKELKEGNLKVRINKAADDHLITKDMAKWAHQIRLDANDQRHSDEDAALPTAEEAQRSLTFALALAEFLFVLPARVTRGIEETK